MNVRDLNVMRRIADLGTRFTRRSARKYARDLKPFHLELYSAEQIERYGRTLAKAHRISMEKPYEMLLSRLNDNEKLLLDAHALLVGDIAGEQPVTPAGEWLLDNFYVLEDQIRLAKLHLPKGYSRGLPHLASGSSAGLPRVYDLALEAITHSDGRFNAESFVSFLAAYQTRGPLTLGELWAVPIMLRLALIENIRRVASLVASSRLEHILASIWAAKLIQAAVEQPKNLVLAIADMARTSPRLTSPFVAELTRRLRGTGADTSLPLAWLERQLADSGEAIEQLVHRENQAQAARQVSIGNCIGSLRSLENTDWREVVENLSEVEKTLRSEPCGVYANMDFATRDRYRHVVEKLARHGLYSEKDVAGRAVCLAKEGLEKFGLDSPCAHVGFYLIGKGKHQLDSQCAARRAFGFLRFGRMNVFPLYMGSVIVLSVLFTGLIAAAADIGSHSAVFLVPAGILLFLGASHLGVAVVNWLAALIAVPHPLPRMDFSKGIPERLRTLVVVPAMLTSVRVLEDLFRQLEIRFLANRDDALHFALLTDFCDAPGPEMPEDASLLDLAKRKTEALNSKYPGDSFFLFHRARLWNEQENAWMGHERKRGKIADLNALLRSSDNGSFSDVVGNAALFPEIRYVVTLDTDTMLARDSARQLVGTMAHPLNGAVYDEALRRVDSGYGILQPRVAAGLSGANRSAYARIWANEAGVDPYTRAVSDVYQDLFGEGSYIGKGIYDVDVFERALAGKFPDNKILSHDLLEGCYARSGLISDVQLYEAPPSDYLDDMLRRRRWVRGDWQIANWVLPFVPGPESRLVKNPLSALSRWKILDNLRRSLAPIFLLALFSLGWLLLPSSGLWTIGLAGVILLPAFMTSLLNLLRKKSGLPLRAHIAAAARAVPASLAPPIFFLACLPFEALSNGDAIVRSCWRMIFSHKLLLQWQPSAVSLKNISKGLAATLGVMWVAPCTAVALAAAVAIGNPAALPAAGPVLLLWLLSPVMAWRLSVPAARHDETLTPEESAHLRALARKTWNFFETFVGDEDNWLPPDNHQEYPVVKTAHRTSPTNMGLALLANLAAYDFGFITAGKCLDRTAPALQSMEKLERYKGHFLNWYDTRTLKPLLPRYASSVDSGNLVGYLLVLRAGLQSLGEKDIIGPQFFSGLACTLGLSADAEGAFPAVSSHIDALKTEAAACVQTAPRTPSEMFRILERLAIQAEKVCEHDDAPFFATSATRQWVSAFAGQARDALAELVQFAPWAAISVPESLRDALPEFSRPLTLNSAAELEATVIPRIRLLRESPRTDVEETYLSGLHDLVRKGSGQARARMAALAGCAERCGRMTQMEYDFLYDSVRHLLSTGFSVDEGKKDSGNYDLLASEARLATFVGIACGKLPQESWFAMGRPLTIANGAPLLLSWSGSMFEYLMPLLIMPSYARSLLDETCKSAVKAQTAYGKARGVPWGVSESGYAVYDAQGDYQYKAFGVPGLGFKRGLAGELVIAPYATVLALMAAPKEACKNLARLSREGFETQYGLYEAVDYTASRLPQGKKHETVRSFMAHHQGMSLLALGSILLDNPMQKRFASDLALQGSMLLLQERIPQVVSSYVHTAIEPILKTTASQEDAVRVFTTPNTARPEVQLLSNGRYHVMLTNAGGGYSRWKNLAVTRWREDATRDNWGTFCYFRETAQNRCWSTTHQPVQTSGQRAAVIFSEGRVEFKNHAFGYDSHTTVVVSPEDDVELRRTRITNRNRTRATLDVTSFAEVALTDPASDSLHPAFSNLFIQTEIVRDNQAILCTRRPRSRDERFPCMLHMLTVHGAQLGKASYETDRGLFVGRERTLANPRGMDPATTVLSDSEGSVLDPSVSVRARVSLQPGESVVVDMVTGVGETRAAALELTKKYRDRDIADRVFDMAWTHGHILLRQLNASESEGQLYNSLAGAVIYAGSGLRASSQVLAQNRKGQSGLWGYAISGDLPIVLLRIKDQENIELVRQLVRAHAYWRLKGLAVDLVVWNEDGSGYRQHLLDQITRLVAERNEGSRPEKPGGVFVRSPDRIAEEDRILLKTVARAILSDTEGSLREQVKKGVVRAPTPAALAPSRAYRPVDDAAASASVEELQFFNGTGGFSPDGKEYVIITDSDTTTPAPWVNVLANPDFGSVISEGGLAYTWSENAHEFRITPWSNDPVGDSQGEAFYLRDEEDGYYWSPSPQPCRGKTPYCARHGFGYSAFAHKEHGLSSELLVYVDAAEAVKYSVLRVRNLSERNRMASATGYVSWVLGDLPEKTAMHVITEREREDGPIFARNHYNTEFPGRTVFFDAQGESRSITCDRAEFLGRNGRLGSPAAMARGRLSGKTGAGLDPCAAIRIPFSLGPGEERVLVFRLGVGENAWKAGDLAARCREAGAEQKSLEAVRRLWASLLGAVQVTTPDPSFTVMANGWLLYQVVSCRLWGRSATYQSGGAFGFRDQLQDAMALVHTAPGLLREHLLRCAARQFSEGDVLHWWHPPVGRGVRTRCSDDYLWLPFAAARYVLATGDVEALDEQISFINGRPLNEGEESYYDLPVRSEEKATLYEHCVRAVLHGLRFGAHGLPLIGSGDWNDGMNLVGLHGKGESVWLGFFLYSVLRNFAPLAAARGDTPFADLCLNEAEVLRRNIETSAWDGEWYRRAYFDDGAPLGSAKNDECRIDSIAQSWAVLSGAADAARASTALDFLEKHLVRRDYKLIQLFAPSFDSSALDPGYIKGYVPGVRENGGQYTHAAIWAAMAFAEQGDAERALELCAMINPVNHGNSPEKAAVYKTEPYVVAADVYAAPGHAGRGGWTWYTGAASWMYRLMLESMLGVRLENGSLRIVPCLPRSWSECAVSYLYGETRYNIVYLRQGEPLGEVVLLLDGTEQSGSTVLLANDRAEHRIEVRLPGVF